MSRIKRFVKSNPHLFHSMKQGLLYIRYIMSLFTKDKYSNLNKFPVLECFEIKEKGYHCYFGYYDKSPVNQTGEYVAFLKIKNGAWPGDVAYICIYNIATGLISTVGQTDTWNWQQGCMLQWVKKDTLAFNSYNKNSDKYETKIININDP